LLPFTGNADHFRPNCTIPPTQGLGNSILSDRLWDRGCSLRKLLVSPPEKTGIPIISHANYPPRLRCSHAPPQHLDVIPIDLSSCWVHVPTRDTTRWPRVSSNHTCSHHLGRKWVHGENSNPPPGKRLTVLQIWRCIISYQDASNRPRILITVLLSLLSLVSLGRPLFISTLPFEVAHETIRMRCYGVSRQGYDLLNSVHITLPSRQYHTLSTDCFPTHLPSKSLPRCAWIRTRISLYQYHDDVCRIFSTSCHFQWHIHCPNLRPAAADRVWGTDPLPTSPSYFRRWPETPWHLKYV